MSRRVQNYVSISAQIYMLRVWMWQWNKEMNNLDLSGCQSVQQRTLGRNAGDVRTRHRESRDFSRGDASEALKHPPRRFCSGAARSHRNVAVTRCGGRYSAPDSHLNPLRPAGCRLSSAGLSCCSPECLLLWRPCTAALTRWARMMWTTGCISEWSTSSRSKTSPSSSSTGRTPSRCWRARCSASCTLPSQGKKGIKG